MNAAAYPNQEAIRARAAREEMAFATSKSPALQEKERDERRQQREARSARPAAQPKPPEVVVSTTAPTVIPPVQGRWQAETDEPVGLPQVVKCPLPEYLGVEVTYRTNNLVRVMNSQPPVEDTKAYAAWLGTRILGVAWPWKKPPPDPGTEEGMLEYKETTTDLFIWMVRDGYSAALEQAAGPQFRGDPA
jgi:hypothetical protein